MHENGAAGMAGFGQKQSLACGRYLPRKGRLSVADNNSKVPHEPKGDSVTDCLETELVMDTELGFLTQRDGALNRSCHDDFACLATQLLQSSVRSVSTISERTQRWLASR